MESENKRATKGTEHTLSNVNQKIGGEFVKTQNAPFIEERAKQWDIYYKAQEEKLKSLPKEKITITMKDGKQIEGMSNETSPYEIGKKHLKQSLMKEVLVAKVCYSKRLVSHKIVSAEEEEQVKKEASRCLKCGRTFVDETMCVGCGLCTTRCKFDAIHLRKRFDGVGTPYKQTTTSNMGHILARNLKIVFTGKGKVKSMNKDDLTKQSEKKETLR